MDLTSKQSHVEQVTERLKEGILRKLSFALRIATQEELFWMCTEYEIFGAQVTTVEALHDLAGVHYRRTLAGFSSRVTEAIGKRLGSTVKRMGLPCHLFLLSPVTDPLCDFESLRDTNDQWMHSLGMSTQDVKVPDTVYMTIPTYVSFDVTMVGASYRVSTSLLDNFELVYNSSSVDELSRSENTKLLGAATRSVLVP